MGPQSEQIVVLVGSGRLMFRSSLCRWDRRLSFLSLLSSNFILADESLVFEEPFVLMFPSFILISEEEAAAAL